MLEITSKLKVRRDAFEGDIRDRLVLPFELRQKTRLRTKLESGEEVGLMLPPGDILRGGDLLQAADGRVVEVVASDENVVEARCTSMYELARAAYHLGNRHVSLQIGDGWLRIADDHVLRQMLEGLGLTVTAMKAPFEPEPGAYGKHEHGGHSHQHLDDAPPTHGGVIHQFGRYAGKSKPGLASLAHGHSHHHHDDDHQH